MTIAFYQHECTTVYLKTISKSYKVGHPSALLVEILYLILYDIYEKALTTVYYMLPDGLRLQILFVNLCPMFLIFSRLSCSNNVMIKAYTVG